MTTITLDKKTRVTWVAAEDGIVDIAAPTVAELTAGTDIQGFMTPDGLNLPSSTGSIDNSNLDSDFTTNQVGRVSYGNVSLKLQRQTQKADATAVLLGYGNEGFLVVRRGVPSATAYTATTDEVEVYPMQCGGHSTPQSGPEQIWTYEVTVAVTASPELSAVVAAGS